MTVNVGLNKRRNKKSRTQRFNSVHNSVMTFVSSSSSSYKWRAKVGVFALVFCVVVLLGVSLNTWYASRNGLGDDELAPIYTVEIVNEFPHDQYAFTQGLLYWGNDTLYESTGLYGQSTVRKVDLQTGKVEIQRKMDESIFGEGLTLLDDKLYQVTWMENTGFIYERDNFDNVTTFTHHMKDGWGLTTDGKSLFGTDGSSTLYQMDPKTMKVIQKQKVRYEGQEVQSLNELEYINGEVWANIFVTDCIVRLSPRGKVVGWILLPNLSEQLVQEGSTYFDVLNGIAWDSDKKRIFVTGKLWPKLFEIKLRRVKDRSQFNIRQLCIPNALYSI
ncbi:hypothetical protein RND81_14G111700 [Saponaria officinalis]|uniref:Glutaminyl-peptide cyclotransferase n=2 Tax=Saponaria officinalis TaxID=3572 RepID=A0AAW1GNY1_SAPOF